MISPVIRILFIFVYLVAIVHQPFFYTYWEVTGWEVGSPGQVTVHTWPHKNTRKTTFYTHLNLKFTHRLCFRLWENTGVFWENTQRDHANSKQKGPNQESNPQPSCNNIQQFEKSIHISRQCDKSSKCLIIAAFHGLFSSVRHQHLFKCHQFTAGI